MTASVDADLVYRPRVVVKFYDGVGLPYDSSATDEIRRRFDPDVHFFNLFPSVVFEPLFYSQSPDDIKRIVARARSNDTSYEAPDFLSFFIVPVPPTVDPEQLRAALSALQGVTHAHVTQPPVEPPAVNPGGNPFSQLQNYLDPAPIGIDARFAWTQSGGDGFGQRLVDVEYGWAIEHEDLRAHHVDVFSGRNASYIPHGTAILGIVAAEDNHVGCIGIVPNLQSLRCAGVVRIGGSVDLHAALMDAAAAMNLFDVLLLEVQYGLQRYPAELEDQIYEAVRLLTAAGVTVVACAGNGTLDLDTVTSDDGKFVFNRGSPDFRDSGATFVGGATWDQRVRVEDSNYGSRVDCFAWGTGVTTTYSNEAGTNHRRYTRCANGTSAAGAIVAGAAVAVQGIAQARYNARYQPRKLRALLSDPANTPSESPVFDRIGVMPDLRRLICDLMQHPQGLEALHGTVSR